MLERTPQQAKNRDEFTDAIRLFYDKASVAEYNFQKLYSLHTPVAGLNAIHSDSAASSANPDDAGGLHPVIFLANQACVMLTANIWQEVGLCNGAAGTVHQLLYQADHKPPDLPIAVLVNFDNYAGRHSSVVSQTACLSLHCHLNGNLMDDDCLVSKYPPTLLCDNYTQKPKADP